MPIHANAQCVAIQGTWPPSGVSNARHVVDGEIWQMSATANHSWRLQKPHMTLANMTPSQHEAIGPGKRQGHTQDWCFKNPEGRDWRPGLHSASQDDAAAVCPCPSGMASWHPGGSRNLACPRTWIWSLINASPIFGYRQMSSCDTSA